MPSLQGASAYRQAAAEGATQIGLLIIAYDALAREFSRAGQAAHRNDIAARCKHSSLALTLLGHLESWTGYLENPLLAESLKQFYGVLRGRTLHIQGCSGPEDFENLAQLVIDTRAAWQQKEHQLSASLSSRGPEGNANVLIRNPSSGSSSFRCSV